MSYKERLYIFWLQDCMDDFNPQLVSLYLTNISFKLLSCVCACARERKREERAEREREWYTEVNIFLSSPRLWKRKYFCMHIHSAIPSSLPYLCCHHPPISWSLPHVHWGHVIIQVIRYPSLWELLKMSHQNGASTSTWFQTWPQVSRLPLRILFCAPSLLILLLNWEYSKNITTLFKNFRLLSKCSFSRWPHCLLNKETQPSSGSCEYFSCSSVYFQTFVLILSFVLLKTCVSSNLRLMSHNPMVSI